MRLSEAARQRILAKLPGGEKRHLDAIEKASFDYIHSFKLPKRQRAQRDRLRTRLLELRGAADRMARALSRHGEVQAEAARILFASFPVHWSAADQYASDRWTGVAFDRFPFAPGLSWAGLRIAILQASRGEPTDLTPGALRRLRESAEIPTGRPPDDAEAILLWHLALVWRESTGKLPRPTGGLTREQRGLGPFERFTHALLQELPVHPGDLTRAHRRVCNAFAREHTA